MDASARSINQLQGTGDGPRQSSVVVASRTTDGGGEGIDISPRSSELSGPAPSSFPPKSERSAGSGASGPSGSLDDPQSAEEKSPGRRWETLAEYLALSSRDGADEHDSPHDSDSDEAPWSLGGRHGRSAEILDGLKQGLRMHITPSSAEKDDADVAPPASPAGRAAARDGEDFRRSLAAASAASAQGPRQVDLAVAHTRHLPRRGSEMLGEGPPLPPGGLDSLADQTRTC
ncbi:hypothetical protein THAOC_03699, partial [Thalassiosira oceanica]